MKNSLMHSVLSGLAVSVVLCASAVAADYKLTSLDWPPYTNEKLPAQGASAAVVSEAFKAGGDAARIEFYPWSRAVHMAKTDKAYVAYFPEYYSKENAAAFLYSARGILAPLIIHSEGKPVSRWS